MKRETQEEAVVPIDHARIIDNSGSLANQVNYLPFDSSCGVCDAEIRVTAQMQKRILEIERLPVHMLRHGAIFCEACRDRRDRIHSLREKKEGSLPSDELHELQKDEETARQASSRRYQLARWPYAV